MSMINISELCQEKIEKEQAKKNIYDNVLKNCHNRIILSSKMYPYQQWCFYVIPKYIYGIPLYNLNNCINYLVVHLTKNGFTVNYTHPNLLIINWINSPKNKSIESTKTDYNSDHKSITDYKPSGNLIYNQNSMKILNKKKNSLFN